MKLIILLMTISAVVVAGEVEVKVLNTTSKAGPQKKKSLEKKLTRKIKKKSENKLP